MEFKNVRPVTPAKLQVLSACSQFCSRKIELRLIFDWGAATNRLQSGERWSIRGQAQSYYFVTDVLAQNQAPRLKVLYLLPEAVPWCRSRIRRSVISDRGSRTAALLIGMHMRKKHIIAAQATFFQLLRMIMYHFTQSLVGQRQPAIKCSDL
jgi:hypothetical protein